MEFINKNIGGIWVAVPVSNPTVKRIMGETFSTNQKIMDKLKKEMPEDQYTEGERIAVFNTMARHYHYAVDSFVAEKIADGTVRKDDVPEL